MIECFNGRWYPKSYGLRKILPAMYREVAAVWYRRWRNRNLGALWARQIFRKCNEKASSIAARGHDHIEILDKNMGQFCRVFSDGSNRADVTGAGRVLMSTFVVNDLEQSWNKLE